MACSDSDATLWQAASHGSIEAYTELRHAHQGLVRSELRRRCAMLNPADLEDLEQEVWIAVWAALPRFQGRSTFDTWLVGITKHVLWAWLRRQHVAELKLLGQRLGEDAERHSLDEQSPLEHLCTNEAVNRLSGPESQVITLRYFHQFSDQEIALRLHVPLGTVKGRLRRGLQHLRQR